MPSRKVLSMRPQICTRSKLCVVKLKIQMMSLQIHEYVNRRNGCRKFPKRLAHILRLHRNAFAKLRIMNLGTASHPRAIIPRPRSIRMKRTSWAKFSLDERVGRGIHIRVMWWSVGREHALEASGVGERPTRVGINAET